jgi:hypothetical protein
MMQFKLSGAHGGLANFVTDFSLNFTTTGHVRGTFSLESLQNALERMRQRHPLLATRITPATETSPACLTTEGVPAIPLRVVERHSDEDWLREVEREIVIPTKYAIGPMLRCVWVRGADVSDIVLVCDHLAGDGLAGVYALRTLLEFLADPTLEMEPLVPPSLIDVLPPDMLTLMRNVLASIKPSQEMPSGPPPRPVTHHPLHILPFELNEAETSTLLERCRAEGTTVQAALCTAFSLQFAIQHPEQPIRKIESPMNLRPRLIPNSGEVYGNYISLLNTDIDCTPGLTHAWEIARQVRQNLQNVTDAEIFSIPILLLAVADRPPAGPIVDVNYDLSLSNLGRVIIPTDYGPLHLEAIHAPTMAPASPNHRILGVTTFNGSLRCTFASYDPDAPNILRRTHEIITSMLTA